MVEDQALNMLYQMLELMPHMNDLQIVSLNKTFLELTDRLNNEEGETMSYNNPAVVELFRGFSEKMLDISNTKKDPFYALRAIKTMAYVRTRAEEVKPKILGMFINAYANVVEKALDMFPQIVDDYMEKFDKPAEKVSAAIDAYAKLMSSLNMAHQGYGEFAGQYPVLDEKLRRNIDSIVNKLANLTKGNEELQKTMIRTLLMYRSDEVIREDIETALSAFLEMTGHNEAIKGYN